MPYDNLSFVCLKKKTELNDIWCMVPEIWSTTDINFCHSGPLFALLPPYGPKKSKFSKKWKNHLRYYHFSHMTYGSSDMEYNWQNFLSLWTIFCPFTSLTTQKLKFWKNEKIAWRYYHFTQVEHKWESYNVWFQRYWAWQTKFFVILDHFLPLYPPKNLKNQKLINWTILWCMVPEIRSVWRTEFFVILDHFLHFYPCNNLKNQNFEKMNKKTGDIIILHKYTTNDNHMMYGSWDMKCDRQIFLSFWTIFCPFNPWQTEKSKF